MDCRQVRSRDGAVCSKLAETGRRAAGLPAALFELCVRNPDKGAVARSDVDARLAAFASRGLAVALTAAPLFSNKASLFPRSTFALGYDTAARIVQERYYGGPARMAAAFAELKAQGCAFAVAGRAEGGAFRTLRDIDMPDVLAEMDLFTEISETDFREDISSTELRKRQQQSS
jgi:hypothetical protein